MPTPSFEFQSHLYGIESNGRKGQCAPVYSFNRTFMELKGCPGGWCLVCFNRTFMELKESANDAASAATTGFNRTFMELKVIVSIYAVFLFCVSIAPLWN